MAKAILRRSKNEAPIYVGVRIDAELQAEIHAWRRRQPDLPNISEVIRHCLKAVIGGDRKGVKSA